MSLNLKKAMSDIGMYFKKELENNIRNQSDISKNPFSLIKPSTAKRRQSLLGANKSHVSLSGKHGIDQRTGKKRKKAVTSVPLHRLLFTGTFWQNAFRFTSLNDSVTVSVSNDIYRSPITDDNSDATYSEIVRRNNRGSSQVNRHITNPPLIFPNNNEEVMQMDAYRLALDRLNEGMQSGEIAEGLLQGGVNEVITIRVY